MWQTFPVFNYSQDYLYLVSTNKKYLPLKTIFGKYNAFSTQSFESSLKVSIFLNICVEYQDKEAKFKTISVGELSWKL